MRRTTRRKILAYIGGGIASFGALYFSHGRVPVEETTEVTLKASQFEPRNIHVDQGATVEWKNNQSFTHVLVPNGVRYPNGDTGDWRLRESGDMGVEVGGNSSLEYTFEESGVYDLFCNIHGNPDMSGMSMRIAVGDAEMQKPLGSWF